MSFALSQREKRYAPKLLIPVLACLAALFGCGGGSGSSSSGSTSNSGSDSSYSVGGTLTGLTSGAQVTLDDNGGSPLTLTADGAFSFAAPVTYGGAYSVSVAIQPNGQICTINDGSGTVAGTVTTVQVVCEYEEQVLYRFAGLNSGDGSSPIGGLIADSAGNLYGTAATGGSNTCYDSNGDPIGCGIVFKLSPDGNGGYTKSTLYTFADNGGNDGATPLAGLLLDSAGNLYGTTSDGGLGYGTVFKLSPNGSGGYNESILYRFTGQTDGGWPQYGALVMDGSGNLYGTAMEGGNFGQGVVFKLAPNGTGGYDESTLHSFGAGTDAGSQPYGGLILDAAGNLYGTTSAGCAISGSSHGSVFELTPASGGGYSESILHCFTGGSDGSQPYATLAMDSGGSLYGTTEFGGDADYGTVFELSPVAGGGYTESVLYAFPGGGDGSAVLAGVVLDGAGDLFGATGANTTNDGTVFELSPAAGGGYTESVLYRFTNPSDGANPEANLLLDSAGHLYGTTQEGGGGSPGYGIVFEIPTH